MTLDQLLMDFMYNQIGSMPCPRTAEFAQLAASATNSADIAPKTLGNPNIPLQFLGM